MIFLPQSLTIARYHFSGYSGCIGNLACLASIPLVSNCPSFSYLMLPSWSRTVSLRYKIGIQDVSELSGHQQSCHSNANKWNSKPYWMSRTMKLGNIRAWSRCPPSHFPESWSCKHALGYSTMNRCRPHPTRLFRRRHPAASCVTVRRKRIRFVGWKWLSREHKSCRQASNP